MREVPIKNPTYYFFYVIINIKNFDPNNIKIDKKSYKNIITYYIGYVTPISVKPLYLIINKVNECIEIYNGNKFFMLVHADKSREALKTYKELWKKIKDFIKSKNNNSDD